MFTFRRTFLVFCVRCWLVSVGVRLRVFRRFLFIMRWICMRRVVCISSSSVSGGWMDCPECGSSANVQVPDGLRWVLVVGVDDSLMQSFRCASCRVVFTR